MGGPGEGIRPRLRDQEGRHRLLPFGVVPAGVLLRLLIATTDHVGPTARSTLDEQESRSAICCARSWSWHRRWPTSPHDLRPRRRRAEEAVPHVKEAIRGRQGLRWHRPRPTRHGLRHRQDPRRPVAFRPACRKRTLLLLPSLSLAGADPQRVERQRLARFDYLAVCSDETVAGRGRLVASTSELGIPVTTDPERIAHSCAAAARNVVLATYQSSPQIAAAQRGRVPAFDLVIADEAHRCAGQGRRLRP